MKKQKIVRLVELLLVWIELSCVWIVISCIRAKENIGLLVADVKSNFINNAMVPMLWKDKLLVLSMLFILLLILVALTKRFSWKIRAFSKVATIREDSKCIDFGIHALAIGGLVTLVLLFGVWVKRFGGIVPMQSFEGDVLIARAGGGIEGVDATNSKEAILQSYQNGIRVVEIEFSMTADGEVVCWSGWQKPVNDTYQENEILTKEVFLNSQIQGQYTTLSLEGLFELMDEYKDLSIVTDTKGSSFEDVTAMFEAFFRTAQETNHVELLNRFVVQLYHHEMYDVVNEIYPFSNYILTLYQCGGPYEEEFLEHCRFCRARGINAITMWVEWADEENVKAARNYDIDVYVHTVNEPERVEQCATYGVKGYYTDFLIPQMME